MENSNNPKKPTSQKQTRSKRLSSLSNDVGASTSQASISAPSTDANVASNTPTSSSGNVTIPQMSTKALENAQRMTDAVKKAILTKQLDNALASLNDMVALSGSWNKRSLKKKKKSTDDDNAQPGTSKESHSSSHVKTKRRSKSSRGHIQNSSDEHDDPASNSAVEDEGNNEPGEQTATADPVPSITIPFKRPLDNHESPEAKRAKLANSGDDGIKMAIVPLNYPDTVIIDEMVPILQKAIWDKLEKFPDPLPKLSIGGITTGALHVTCEDEAAVEFLKKLDGLDVEDLIILRIVNAKDLPKPVKMAWRTRNVGCTDTTRVLKMLQRLNPTLRTNEWKVIDTVVEPTHSRRIVLVDRISANVIKEAGYTLPAGIDKCSFKVIETARKNVQT